MLKKLEELNSRLREILARFSQTIDRHNSLVQYAIGVGIGLMVLSFHLYVNEEYLTAIAWLAGLGILLVILGSLYSVVYIAVRTDERIFHFVWIAAFVSTTHLTRQFGLPAHWNILHVLGGSWFFAFASDLLFPYIPCPITRFRKKPN